MALSIGGLSAYGNAVAVRPMNYAVENQSQVSSAYQDSVKQLSGAGSFPGIGATNPVQYANAQYVKVDSTVQVQRAQEAKRGLNTVASGFAGRAVGYDEASATYGYEMIGSTLDLYA